MVDLYSGGFCAILLQQSRPTVLDMLDGLEVEWSPACWNYQQQKTILLYGNKNNPKVPHVSHCYILNGT